MEGFLGEAQNGSIRINKRRRFNADQEGGKNKKTTGRNPFRRGRTQKSLLPYSTAGKLDCPSSWSTRKFDVTKKVDGP